jgi:predicted acetyltransferase
MINESNHILGVVHIRHRLNEYLLFRGGHIGYAIRPSERRKGYATKLLSLALMVCKTMHIEKVLVTCAKNNIGSAKTIIKNGGILYSEGIDNGELFQRYWIDLR